MEHTVTFHTCVRELVEPGGPRVADVVAEWESRPTHAKVRAFAKGMVHRALYQVTPADIEAALARGEHALGDVESEEQEKEVEDFNTPFSWNDVFHGCLEERGGVPSWNEFRTWITQEHPQYVWEPLKARFDVTKPEYKRAIRWRIGKCYYSLIREIWLLSRLRCDYGIFLNYHVFADVRLRIDFWTGKHLFCLYFPNSRYRDGREGRKLDPRELYRGTDFLVTELEATRQGYGRAWLAKEHEVARLAVSIQEALASGD